MMTGKWVAIAAIVLVLAGFAWYACGRVHLVTRCPGSITVEGVTFHAPFNIGGSGVIADGGSRCFGVAGEICDKTHPVYFWVTVDFSIDGRSKGSFGTVHVQRVAKLGDPYGRRLSGEELTDLYGMVWTSVNRSGGMFSPEDNADVWDVFFPRRYWVWLNYP